MHQQGLGILAAPTSVRICAALYASRLLAERDVTLAKPYLRVAIEIIPFVSHRALCQSDNVTEVVAERWMGTTTRYRGREGDGLWRYRS